jgi:hypothetical protein
MELSVRLTIYPVHNGLASEAALHGFLRPLRRLRPLREAPLPLLPLCILGARFFPKPALCPIHQAHNIATVLPDR